MGFWTKVGHHAKRVSSKVPSQRLSHGQSPSKKMQSSTPYLIRREASPPKVAEHVFY